MHTPQRRLGSLQCIRGLRVFRRWLHILPVQDFVPLLLDWDLDKAVQVFCILWMILLPFLMLLIVVVTLFVECSAGFLIEAN